MGVSNMDRRGYRRIELCCRATFFLIALMALSAYAETVPSLPAPATMQSVGGWYYDSSLRYPPYPGAPSGQAFCDYWSQTFAGGVFKNQLVFRLGGSGFGGLCVRQCCGDYIAQPYYLEVCPPGYSSPNSGYTVQFTCYNYSAANQCPAVAEGENPYILDPGGQTCSRCPPNSSGTFPNACTCNDGYEPDPTKTSCVPVDTCPQVKALTPLPKDDACALALENLQTTQAQKDAACGTLTPAMKTAKSCLANKLDNLGTTIPLVVTADIRSIAYQAHLREIWDKMERLVRLEDDPAMQAACAARRAEIAAEKGCDNADKCTSCYPESATQRSHCLKARPANSSQNDAQHTQGRAIDVSEARTIAPLRSYLSAVNPPQDVQQFLNAPTNCNLNWGGTFVDNPDLVHFYVP